MASFKHVSLLALVVGLCVLQITYPRSAPADEKAQRFSWDAFVSEILSAGKVAAESDMWLERAEAARTEVWARHALQESQRLSSVRDAIVSALVQQLPEKNNDIRALVAVRTVLFTRVLYGDSHLRSALLVAPTEVAARWIQEQNSVRQSQIDESTTWFETQLAKLKTEFPAESHGR